MSAILGFLIIEYLWISSKNKEITCIINIFRKKSWLILVASTLLSIITFKYQKQSKNWSLAICILINLHKKPNYLPNELLIYLK